MENETFYSSSEVARQLGISDATLRTWKSRYSDRLIENVHWAKNSDGSTLWTETGLLQLHSFRNGSVARNGNGETEAFQDETEALQDRYSPLVDAVADALTTRLLQRIDRQVKGNVQRAIATPMSPSECISVLEDLGIKPADPLALIKGSNIAGLLNETTETGD